MDNAKSSLARFANYLTIGRVVFTLPIVLSLSLNLTVLAWSFFLLAGLTDIADGWLARLAGGGSKLGARLDPLADKICISAPLIWLVSEGILPFWAVWTLISRELIISAWRSSEFNGGPASFQGKVKTILQFTSILLMLWPTSLGGERVVSIIQKLGLFLFWPSLLIAFISCLKYLTNQSKMRHS